MGDTSKPCDGCYLEAGGWVIVRGRKMGDTWKLEDGGYLEARELGILKDWRKLEAGGWGYLEVGGAAGGRNGTLAGILITPPLGSGSGGGRGGRADELALSWRLGVRMEIIIRV